LESLDPPAAGVEARPGSNRQDGEQGAGPINRPRSVKTIQKDIAAVEAKIANVRKAIEDGLGDAVWANQRLVELQSQLQELQSSKPKNKFQGSRLRMSAGTSRTSPRSWNTPARGTKGVSEARRAENKTGPGGILGRDRLPSSGAEFLSGSGGPLRSPTEKSTAGARGD